MISVVFRGFASLLGESIPNFLQHDDALNLAEPAMNTTRSCGIKPQRIRSRSPAFSIQKKHGSNPNVLTTNDWVENALKLRIPSSKPQKTQLTRKLG
jgi:Tfp pilus assembly protein PilZ